MDDYRNIDLHMHTTISDGTDTPQEILERVREAGFTMFSVTDHDAVKGCRIIRDLRTEKDPLFIPGIEFSCKDEKGKYHILGYGYDPDSEGINKVVNYGHSLRMKKLQARLDFLKDTFRVVFPEEALKELMALDNPGKPHIGNLMVRYGYTKTKEQAIKEYINKIHLKNAYVRPEQAIEGILVSGGIPVLAHPVYGSGDQLILGEELEERIDRLMAFGLKGVEAFYSGFTDKLRRAVIRIAEERKLYITAGSDYHGQNKLIEPGDTGLAEAAELPEGLICFIEDVLMKP